MNAHQRRKARRAAERWMRDNNSFFPPLKHGYVMEWPDVLLIHPDSNKEWMRELSKPTEVPEGLTLIRGEIGRIEAPMFPQGEPITPAD